MKVHPARAPVEQTTRTATLAMVAIGAVGALGALTCVFDDLDVPGVLCELLSCVAWIPAATLFCLWLHRAYRDAVDLEAPPLRFTPAGAVASFFLPIVGLYRPYRAVVDLYEACDPAVRGTPRTDRSAASAPARAPWFPARSWWALWLVGPLVASLLDNAGLIGALGSFDPDNPTAFVSSLEGGSSVLSRVLAGAVRLASAILAILVVRAIVRRQRQCLDRLERD
jgi:hypothetical protein